MQARSFIFHSLPWWSVNDFLRQGLGNIPLEPQKTLENSFEFFCLCSTCNEVKKNRRVSRKCQTNSTTLLLLLHSAPCREQLQFLCLREGFCVLNISICYLEAFTETTDEHLFPGIHNERWKNICCRRQKYNVYMFICSKRNRHVIVKGKRRRESH